MPDPRKLPGIDARVFFDPEAFARLWVDALAAELARRSRAMRSGR